MKNRSCGLFAIDVCFDFIVWSDKLDGSQLRLPSTMVVRQSDHRTIMCVFPFGSRAFPIIRLITPFWEKTQTLFPSFRVVYDPRTDKPSFPNGTSAAVLLRGISKTANHLPPFGTRSAHGVDYPPRNVERTEAVLSSVVRNVQSGRSETICKHAD